MCRKISNSTLLLGYKTQYETKGQITQACTKLMEFKIWDFFSFKERETI